MSDEYVEIDISDILEDLAKSDQLHDNVPSFMSGLKALPKDGPHRGKYITSHMSHVPFLNALQSHPEGKKMTQQLHGFMNSKQNAGAGKGVVSVKSELMQKDLMPGGKGDNVPDTKFDPKELEVGKEKEMEEHGLDPERAKEVSKDHLVEDPTAYNDKPDESGQMESHIMEVLQGFHNNKEFINQLQQSDPEMYEAVMRLIGSVSSLAELLSVGQQ